MHAQSRHMHTDDSVLTPASDLHLWLENQTQAGQTKLRHIQNMRNKCLGTEHYFLLLNAKQFLWAWSLHHLRERREKRLEPDELQKSLNQLQRCFSTTSSRECQCVAVSVWKRNSHCCISVFPRWSWPPDITLPSGWRWWPKSWRACMMELFTSPQTLRWVTQLHILCSRPENRFIIQLLGCVPHCF